MGNNQGVVQDALWQKSEKERQKLKVRIEQTTR